MNTCVHLSPYYSSWLPIPYSRVWVLAAVRLIYPIAARWVWQRNWHHQRECGPACGSPAQQRCLQHSLRFLSTQWRHTHTHIYTVWSLKLKPLLCAVGVWAGGFWVYSFERTDKRQQIFNDSLNQAITKKQKGKNESMKRDKIAHLIWQQKHICL